MHSFSQPAVDSNPAVSVGVQTWSRGEIFPAVIARLEVYDSPCSFEQWKEVSCLGAHERAPYLYRNYLDNFFERTLEERLQRTEWVLHYPGREDARFSSYDLAFSAAQWLASVVGACDAAIARRAVAAGIANVKVARARAALAWVAEQSPFMREAGLV